MAAVNALLGLVGLATRRQLDRAVDRKDRWHGLVRDVFAPYYLKFQQASLDHMPELPRRYSEDWERYIRRQLDAFLDLDLESVGELLDAAGFGTDKWVRLRETGFPALSRLLDRVAANGDGHPSDEAIAAAVSEDLLDLLSRHPDVADEIVRRIDLDSGHLHLTAADVERSEPYQRLLADLDEARLELRRFRRGGQRALDRLRDLDAQLQAMRANGHGGQSEVPFAIGEERGLANLRKMLRARDAAVAALRERVGQLESQLDAARRERNEDLEERAAQAEAGVVERDAAIVRLQERIERLQDEDRAPAANREGDELRQLQADLKARDHALQGLREELERVRAELEAQGAADAAAGEGDPALARRLESLERDLKARDHALEALREQLARLQAEAGPGPAPRRDAGGEADLKAQLQQLQNDLNSRDFALAGLRQELARTEAQLEAAGGEEVRPEAAGADAGQLQSLRNDLKARDHALEALREQLARHETAAPAVRRAEPDPARTAELESLRKDLRAREQTIAALRSQLEAFEQELGQARDRLLAEVRKLSALTSGQLQLKPVAQLEAMDADALLTYARDVAEDLDVRRQTLDEGLQGIESVRGNYEETRRVFESQQRDMESQLEQLRTEAESYRVQDRSGADGTADELKDTIGKQRQQLELLSTRVRQLVATNKDLNDSNKKMYENLESAVKRLIPLRRQIEELESLQEALQRFIRNKYDRTFTMMKLREAGIR